MLAIPPRAQLRARPLEGSRIALVPIDGSDAAELWEAVDASRAWLKPWLPWVPYQTDRQASQQFVEASATDWDHSRALRFGIRTRPSGQLVGVIGLEACIEMHRSCDLGYWLRHDAARRGYMAEAAQLCLQFGFGQVGFHRTRVAAATTNHASLRVIGRLGFRFEGVARHAEWCDGRWLDHAFFSMLDQEWSTR